MKDGIHLGVPDTVYHADCADAPSLSSSVANILLTRSPYHARYAHPRLNPDWKPDEATKEQDFGSAVHALVLEGDEARVRVIDADSYRTIVARENRDCLRFNNFIPLLTEQFERAHAMATVIREQARQTEIADAFDDGDPEVTCIWTETPIIQVPAEMGALTIADVPVSLRTRADWLTTDRSIIIDLKTRNTSAEPNAFVRAILAEGYDIQVALYRRGVKKLTGVDAQFVFLLAESDPPHRISLVSLAPAALAFADHKIQRAIEQWALCLHTDCWPSYAPRIHYVDFPAWAETQFIEREMVDGTASE